MKKLALTRPKVSQVTGWELIAEAHRENDWRNRVPGAAHVYEALDFYDYYKVVTYEGAGANRKTKYFFGEKAWIEVQGYVRDYGCFITL